MIEERLTRGRYFWLQTAVDGQTPRGEKVNGSCNGLGVDSRDGDSLATVGDEIKVNGVSQLILLDKPITIFMTDQGDCLQSVSKAMLAKTEDRASY